MLRKIITGAKLLIGTVKYPFYQVVHKPLKILSRDETLDMVIKSNLSVARFGDSEYLYITGKSDNLQESNHKLQIALKETLQSNNENLLICIVDYFNLSDRNFMSRLSAKMFHTRTYNKYKNYLDVNRVYGNANMTRFYLGAKRKKEAKVLFDKCKKLWDNRKVVIFEGENSIFGVGSDLLSNAKSIQRVICPGYQAFNFYDEIIAKARSYETETLMLFALGTSATVAAHDLSKNGYQVIDIGNLSKEYLQFTIDNKLHINPLKDSDYKLQIIHKIG